MQKTEDYKNLIEKHRKEVEEFPIAYAFSDEQLKEAMKKLGVKHLSECTTIFRMGDIMLKKDVPRYVQLIERHRKEILDAMKDKEYAVAAFRYEMDNHEYAINWDGDSDVLKCFGLTLETLNSMGLADAYMAARKGHMNYMSEIGVI
jgi:hypothetical protein